MGVMVRNSINVALAWQDRMQLVFGNVRNRGNTHIGKVIVKEARIIPTLRSWYTRIRSWRSRPLVVSPCSSSGISHIIR